MNYSKNLTTEEWLMTGCGYEYPIPYVPFPPNPAIFGVTYTDRNQDIMPINTKDTSTLEINGTRFVWRNNTKELLIASPHHLSHITVPMDGALGLIIWLSAQTEYKPTTTTNRIAELEAEVERLRVFETVENDLKELDESKQTTSRPSSNVW